MGIDSQWLQYIPGESFDGAIRFLNNLDWNITIIDSNDQNKVFGGDQLLFASNNEEEIKSFIFGMALGLAVLPDEVLDRIREIIR